MPPSGPTCRTGGCTTACECFGERPCCSGPEMLARHSGYSSTSTTSTPWTGGTPTRYGGILWIFGKFDRPFYRRPIYGTVRYQSLKAAEKKFDVGRYVRRYGGELRGAAAGIRVTGRPLYLADAPVRLSPRHSPLVRTEVRRAHPPAATWLASHSERPAHPDRGPDWVRQDPGGVPGRAGPAVP